MTPSKFDRDAGSIVRLEDLRPGDLPPIAVALGVFDGVHRGHQALLSSAVAQARTIPNAAPAALTFDPHPAAIFAPGRVPPMLTTLAERCALLRRHGAQIVIVARFDRALAAQTPDEFAQRVLRETLGARAVIVGEDFRFGCDRSGDAGYLHRVGKRDGFAVEVIPPVLIDGVPARSTGIRHMVAGGAVEEAAVLLGRPFQLEGEVVVGRRLGRTLGYPTANLALETGLVSPASGVYACRATLADGATVRAAVSVGVNITVDENAPRSVEAYLMDGFSGDLYGQRLSLDFVRRLRPMVRFDSLDALRRQIAADVADVADRVRE